MITEVKTAIIENPTVAGSVFATTKEGESVFINSRIVALLKLCPMDEVRAFVLPNYPDKQSQVPWRAVRVERIDDTASGQPASLSNQRIDDLVLEFLSLGGIYTNAEIAEEIGQEPGVVGSATARLFMLGKISKADVYRRPGQGRPSFLLYAIDVDQFEASE